MNRWIPVFTIVGGLLAGLGLPAAAQNARQSAHADTFWVDTERSLVTWKGTERWGSGSHEGTVGLRNGFLLISEDSLAGGYVVADMHSIAVSDIPAHEPVPRKRLVNHLKSKDFFFVEHYPTARLDIIRTEGPVTGRMKVWGRLTIRDVAKELTFAACRGEDRHHRRVWQVRFNINRFEWNISYQGSYWGRLSSLLDNTFVDAHLSVSVELLAYPEE